MEKTRGIKFSIHETMDVCLTNQVKLPVPVHWSKNERHFGRLEDPDLV
jgi:hypothetical protein